MCHNDFPQRLAESINVLNLKKINKPNATADDLSSLLTNQIQTSQAHLQQQASKHDHHLKEMTNNEDEQKEEEYIKSDSRIQSDDVKASTSADPNQPAPHESDKTNINIDNQEISLLAEHFSVAAFNAIFDDISFSNDLAIFDY